VRLYLKNNHSRTGWRNDSGCTVLSKHEVLSSNPKVVKKKDIKKNRLMIFTVSLELLSGKEPSLSTFIARKSTEAFHIMVHIMHRSYFSVFGL
jgi:hypothetical protein